MSEARPGTSAPTALRVILRRRLQDIRLDAGAQLENAAQAVQTLTVRRLEKAEGALEPLHLRKLLDLAELADEPGWWHSSRDVVPGWLPAYVSRATSTEALLTSAPQDVMGRLQIPDHDARAVLRGGLPPGSAEELAHRVGTRPRRQAPAGRSVRRGGSTGRRPRVRPGVERTRGQKLICAPEGIASSFAGARKAAPMP
ncbi:hypothetical protein ACGFYT_17210 [Streptomyces sp. NPDC048208]|uniref:hypothetical protein n=1 Tax=Streptomyces sp. NPDC048208 TaxID=3365515 RepID=UPI003710F0B2